MSEVVPVKQYGEKRTGTNLMLQLLTRNYSNVQVLINAFGWKHGRWQDPAEWLGGARTPREDKVAFKAYTMEQLKSYLGKIVYVVSVKDPRAWVVSIGKFERKMDADEDYWITRCHAYSHLYSNWLKLREQFAVEVVRYESLLVAEELVCNKIANSFGLVRKNTEWESVVNACGCARDGYLPMTRRKFDSSFYTARRYLAHVTPAMRVGLERGIDWELTARLGYYEDED